MKKGFIYFALIIIGLSITSCTKDKVDEIPTIDYVLIPDNKFEKILIETGIDSDNTINGKVLNSDVEFVEKLELNSSQIDNLTGIEAFINLKRLHAAGNNIETIDLSGNTLLDTLDLAGNALETIDVSLNTKLVYANVYANLLTTTSGFSNASNLDYLSLSFNYLTEFTIENPSLKSLLIDNNDITSFDASLATNLEGLLITTNKLETLNLLNNLKLKTLQTADNKLTELNLVHNNNLTYLSCSSNFLTSLNISNLTNLNFLYAQNNPDLDCIKIANNQDIPTLSLSNYQEVNTNCN